jgi:hypothetical protein
MTTLERKRSAVLRARTHLHRAHEYLDAEHHDDSHIVDLLDAAISQLDYTSTYLNTIIGALTEDAGNGS